MHRNVLINWTIEFGPIVAFFIALSVLGSSDWGIVTSTAIFTLLTTIALGVAYVRDRRIALFPLIAGLSVIFFGAGTVFLKNPFIFIIKDTIYNGFFAILLLGGLFFGKGLLRPLFASLFDMKEEGWYILSLRWGIMFLILALSNEFVWRMYSDAVWVHYKFWSTIATTVFGFYQIRLSRAFRNPTSSPWGMRINPVHTDKYLISD